MTSKRGARIIELLEQLVRLNGGYVPRNTPAPTPEQLKGNVTLIPRRPEPESWSGGLPPSGGTDPDRFWGRRERP